MSIFWVFLFVILPINGFEEFQDTRDTVTGDKTETKDFFLRLAILVVIGLKVLFLTIYFLVKLYKKIKNRSSDSRRTDNHVESESKV